MSSILTWLLAGVTLGTVTSQFLLDVCLIAILLCFLYSLRKNGSRQDRVRLFSAIGIEWALAGYLLVAIASIALNAPEPKPWIYSLRKFTWLFDLYLITWAFSQVSVPLKRWLIFFCFAFLLPNIYAIWGYVIGVDPLRGEIAERVIGLVHSATYHAHGNGVILVFFGTLLLGLWPKLSRNQKVFSSLCLFIMAASVYLTMTRGIWIAASVSSLMVLGFFGKRHITIGFLTLCFTSILLFCFSPQLQERVEGLVEGTSGVDIRKNLIKAHWNMFLDHPLLGIGYWDQYRRIPEYWVKMGMSANYFTSHAHNQYLNVLATTGALGLAFFMSIIIYFLKLNIQLYRRTENGSHRKLILLACLAAQVEFYIACLTDVTFEYAKLRALIILVWALLVALKRDQIKVDSLSD